MMTRSNASFLAGTLGLLAGAWFSFGAPRFTWQNSTLLVDYPGTRSLAALAASFGAALAAWTASRRWLRPALAILAIVAGGLSLQRALYRLEVDSVSLAQRGILGTDRVSWKDVSHVENGPAVFVVRGTGDSQVRIRTGDLQPEDRAILERTVTRRVREASPKR